MTLRLTLFAICLVLSPPVFADEAATPDAAEQASLQSFGAAHPECVEWGDGCAVCKRDDSAHCSTTGIACQPTPIACQTP